MAIEVFGFLSCRTAFYDEKPPFSCYTPLFTRYLMKLNHSLAILFTTEQGCRVAKCCMASLGFLAVVAFGALLSAWWADGRLAFVSGPSVLSSADSESFARIPEAHLFGYYPSSAIATVPITSAPLKLTGIIQFNSPQAEETAKALISIDGGIGKIYQEGEVLPGGLKITAISSEGVLLDRGGRLERLPLQRSRLEKQS